MDRAGDVLLTLRNQRGRDLLDREGDLSRRAETLEDRLAETGNLPAQGMGDAAEEGGRVVVEDIELVPGGREAQRRCRGCASRRMGDTSSRRMARRSSGWATRNGPCTSSPVKMPRSI